jgi:hypothetical protein
MSFQLKALSENGELLRDQLDVGEEKHTYERMLEQLALVFLANALQTFPALLAENTNAKVIGWICRKIFILRCAKL